MRYIEVVLQDTHDDVIMIEISPDLPKVLSSKAIIRFQDCDPYSHLNNSRYLDYFTNAREDQVWKNYDLNIYEYSRQTGLGWVFTQSQIAYLRPALLMEEVTMESQLIECKPKYLKVEMRMFDQRNQLKSLLWAQFVHVDIKAGKSVPHDQGLQDFFSFVLNPIEETDFNQRLAVLSQTQHA